MRNRLWIILILASLHPYRAFAIDVARLASPDAFAFISISDPLFTQKLTEDELFARFYRTWNASRDSTGIYSHLRNWIQDITINHDEWTRIFTGVHCCYLTDLDFQRGRYPVFEASFILEHNGDLEKASVFIEKLLKRIAPDAKKKSFVHNGVNAFTMDHHKEFSYHFQYAFVDHYLFFCEGKKAPLKSLIDRYKSPEALSLSGVKTYQALFEDAPEERSAIVYFNLEDIFRKYAAFYEKEHKKNLSALSLLEFKGFGIAEMIKPKITETWIRLYAPFPRTGFSEAFFQFRENRFAALEFIPNDAIAYASISLDLLRVYHALTSALGVLYPQEVASIRQTIQANNLLWGVQLEDQILGRIKGEIGYYMRKSAGTPSRNRLAEVYFIELENPGAFRESMKKLFLFARNHLALDMREHKTPEMEYWTPAPIGPMGKQDDYIPSFGIVLYEKRLFYSRDISEIESLMGRLKSGETGVSSLARLQEYAGRRPSGNRVGAQIIEEPDLQSVFDGFYPLIEQIVPESPVPVLMGIRNQGESSRSMKTFIYQTRDMLSVITQAKRSGVKLNANDP